MSARARAARGVSTLATLMLLLLASLLAAGWAQRNSLNEIRIAANQLHVSRAFEAAEAGLAWTQAMLNSGTAIGPDCQVATGENSSTFSRRYLQSPDAAGHFKTRSHGVAATPLKMACVQGASGWHCSCPVDAAPTVDASTVLSPGPMFEIQLLPGAAPGSLDVLALGCSRVGKPCEASSAERAEANARLRLTLAFLPSLTVPPVAALTALGDIAAASAPLGLHNADALSGGLAAQAGGQISGNSMRLSSTPGAATPAPTISNDPSLATLPPDQFFNRHFGVDLQQWKSLPGVSRLQCGADCSAALTGLIQSNAEIARVAVDGDLRLSGDLQLGDRSRPLVLVVDGDLLLDGPLQIHGVVHARRMSWNGAAAGSGALLHGAALLSASYSGDAGVDLVYDPALMLRLKRNEGTWLRVPGSWRDF